jgi:choloylglycine hydrolase
LRLADDFPLYELYFDAEYTIEDLYASASSGEGDIAVGESPRSPARPGSGDMVFGCTCFSAPVVAAGDGAGGQVFCRNFDWYANPAMLVHTSPRSGYASIAMVDISYLGYSRDLSPLADPAGLSGAWRLPFDGMNEKGFAIGMMAVPRAQGISGKKRPMVGGLGVMRLLLDKAATVTEALSLMDGVDVDLGNPPMHYYLADASGDEAVVEFIDGEKRVFRSRERWHRATNFLFSDTPERLWPEACSRFALVGKELEQLGGVTGREQAMEILRSVSQPSTRWSAVYAVSELTLTLAVGREYGSPYRFSVR